MYTLIDNIECVKIETPSLDRLCLFIEKQMEKHSNAYNGKCYAVLVKLNKSTYMIDRGI